MTPWWICFPLNDNGSKIAWSGTGIHFETRRCQGQLLSSGFRNSSYIISAFTATGKRISVNAANKEYDAIFEQQQRTLSATSSPGWLVAKPNADRMVRVQPSHPGRLSHRSIKADGRRFQRWQSKWIATVTSSLMAWRFFGQPAGDIHHGKPASHPRRRR